MKRLILIALVPVILSACVPHSKVLYFSDLNNKTGRLAIPDTPELHLKPGDVVEINISSTSLETNEFFRKPGSATDRRYAPNTYLIAPDGTVDIPVIGSVELAGLSIIEAQLFLRELLTQYLQKPSVNMRMMSFRITVLGEVKNPGVFDIPDGTVNLLEAIGMAGDITVFGRRDNVLLIRNAGASKEYVRFSLNDAGAIQSDFFHLQNNDVLYIQPSKGRTAADDNLYRILPLTISALTFAVVLISLTR